MKKHLLLLLLSVPFIANSQILTDHNLTWTISNNPIQEKSAYELKLNFDYVIDLNKKDTVPMLIFNIKEVSALVEGKVNSESFNGSIGLNPNISIIGGLFGGSETNSEIIRYNSKYGNHILINKQIDTLKTYLNIIDSFSYYNEILNRSLVFNIGNLKFGVVVTKDYGGKIKKFQNLTVNKNFFLKIGETNFIFKEIDFIEFKKDLLPTIIKSMTYLEKNKIIKNIDDFR